MPASVQSWADQGQDNWQENDERPAASLLSPLQVMSIPGNLIQTFPPDSIVMNISSGRVCQTLMKGQWTGGCNAVQCWNLG